MWLGKFQLGEELIVSVSTHNSSYVVTNPDAAPLLEIWKDSDKVLSKQMPALTLSEGFFRLGVFLNEVFEEGYYTAIIRYQISSEHKVELHTFRVLPGGNALGAVIGIYQYQRPNARYLVHQTDAGKIFKGRNPRIQ